MGNSPPWYFPLMKRKTNERASERGAIDVGALGDGSCISLPTEASRAMSGGMRGEAGWAKDRFGGS
jgi:hypothetical protein